MKKMRIYSNEEGDLIKGYLDKHEKPLNYVIITGHFAKGYAEYLSINTDLNIVLKTISEIHLIKEKLTISNSLINGALDSAITTLMRCFNSSKGRGRKLHAKSVFKDSEKSFILFNELLDIRNNDIAHANSDVNNLVLYLSKNSRKVKPELLDHTRILRSPNYLLQKTEGIIKLIQEVIDFVDIELKKISPKLSKQLKENGLENYWNESKSIVSDVYVDCQVENGYFISSESKD